MGHWLRLFLIAVGLVLSSSAASSDKIIFSGGAPLDTYQPATIVPLLEEAFRRNSLEFGAVYYPSNRSLLLSNSGRTDGELHRIYDFHQVSGNKYPNLLRIDSKLMSVYLAVFAKEHLDIMSFDDLGGLTIAYQAGRKNVMKLLHDRYPAEMIFSAPSDAQAFKMLAHGRVDVVISESFLGQVLVAGDPEFQGIEEIEKIEDTPIYAYINNKHRSLAPKIAATLESMKQDGSFDRISDQVRKGLLSPH